MDSTKKSCKFLLVSEVHKSDGLGSWISDDYYDNVLATWEKNPSRDCKLGWSMDFMNARSRWGVSYCVCWLDHQSELLCTLTAQLFSSTVHFNCIISSYYRWLLALWRAIHQHKFEKDDECCGFVELRIKWLTIHLHFNHSDIQLLSSECHLLYLSCALFIAIGTLRQLALPIFMGVKKLQQETTKKHHPINL